MKNRKRAQRIADTQRYVAKQKRIAAMYGYTNLGPEQLGRMKGRSHLDCGRTRCPYCCNPRRNAFIPKGMRPTLQERRREE